MCNRCLPVSTRGVCYSWMKVVELNTQSLAALQIVEEGIIGLLRSSFIRVREVD